MYFVDSDHENEFHRLKKSKVDSDGSLALVDYVCSYYILTSTPELRAILAYFSVDDHGIRWESMLSSNVVCEQFRQVVSFAHQLHKRGCFINADFNFVTLLEDVSSDPNLLSVILHASKMYSLQTLSA